MSFRPHAAFQPALTLKPWCTLRSTVAANASLFHRPEERMTPWLKGTQSNYPDVEAFKKRCLYPNRAVEPPVCRKTMSS
jgi:hypothetical protein